MQAIGYCYHMSPNANTLLNRFTLKTKIRHMQVLVKLTELGSMRRTAQAVNMTQPAISQLVAELEALLETELFFRHARGVEPTGVTKSLLPIAHRILSAVEDGAETVADLLNDQGGIVRVSATPAATGGQLPNALCSFAQKYPTVHVNVSVSNDKDPLSALSDGSADLICSRAPKVVPEGWEFIATHEDALSVVCGVDHWLTQVDQPDLEDLGKAKWLQNRIGSLARDRFEAAAKKGNWPDDVRCQIIAQVPEMTRHMVSKYSYLAILPRSVAQNWIEAGSVAELETEINMPLAPLGFMWHPKQASTATAKFADHLSELA